MKRLPLVALAVLLCPLSAYAQLYDNETAFERSLRENRERREVEARNAENERRQRQFEKDRATDRATLAKLQELVKQNEAARKAELEKSAQQEAERKRIAAEQALREANAAADRERSEGGSKPKGSGR